MNTFFKNNFYIFIAIYACGSYIGNDGFLSIIVPLAIKLHTNAENVDLGFAFCILGAVSVQLFLGVLSDKYGRKILLLSGNMIIIISCMASAWVTTIYGFWFFRFTLGIGQAFLYSSGMPAITESYAEKKSLFAISAITNISLLSPILGPYLGVLIYHVNGNIGAVFYYNALLMAVVFVGLLCYMPETNTTKSHDGSQISFKETFLGLLKVSKNKKFVSYAIFLSFSILPIDLWLTASPIIFMTNFHLSDKIYAFWQIPVFILFLLANVITTIVSRYVSLNKIVFFSTAGLYIAVPMLLFLPYVDLSSYYYIVASICIFAFIKGFNLSTASQFILNLSPEFRGSAGSIFGLVQGIAVLIGSAIPGAFKHLESITYLQIAGTILLISLVGVTITTLIYKNDFIRK